MIKPIIRLVLSLSLIAAPFSAHGNLATGVAIGVATDNLALGIAIGAAMEASNNSSAIPAPARVRMVRVLMNGDRSMSPEDAGIFLRHLAGDTEGLDPEQLAEVVEKYDNRRDVKIFLESLYEMDLMKMTLTSYRAEYHPFIEAMNRVLKSDQALAILQEDNRDLGIELEIPAIDNVREIQRGFGLAQMIEELAAKRPTWHLDEFKLGAEQWTSREMIDIRFDIQAKNQPTAMSEDLADAYRTQFAISILRSLDQVHGDNLRDNFSRIRDQFLDGSAYEGYVDRERQRSFAPSEIGIVFAVLVGMGGGFAGLLAWDAYISDWRNPMWLDFGAMLLSLIGGGLGSGAALLGIENTIKRMVHRSKVRNISRLFASSQPVLNGLTDHLRCVGALNQDD